MSKRTLMLASSVRELIAPILRGSPPECGIVTITRIEISSDASYATVYISSLNHPEHALAYLKGEQRDLQKRLAKLERRVIPQLRFRIDDITAKGLRIDQLLEESAKSMSRDSSKTEQGDTVG